MSVGDIDTGVDSEMTETFGVGKAGKGKIGFCNWKNEAARGLRFKNDVLSDVCGTYERN